MIVITGASGKLGHAIADHALRRVPSARLAAASRKPEDLDDLKNRGMDVHACDFADPESLGAAFADADKVLIVSVDKLGDEARTLHRNAIAACARAGVGRIFYTSHAGAKPVSSFAPASQHHATEADLAAAGPSFTALRHGFYAESCMAMIGDDLKAGSLRVPEDGPIAWTVRADLAEADAALLCSAETIDGPTPPLTATSAITMAEITQIASEITGRSIRYEIVSDEEWKDARIAAGLPEPYAEMLLGAFQAARDGDFAATDPLLGELLNRKPTSMREYLRGALA
tara:strand:+ start:837 stop:1694 length:858 start_codon:yes stop_codon:yes gene_type:complete